MAVAVFVRYSNLTPSRYDEIIAGLDLDANPPAGAVLHVAGEEGEAGIVVCEIWRTEETFRSFYDYRLRPALVNHGVEGEPSISIAPLHNLFAAEMETIERMGAVSLPATYAGAAL